MAKMIIHMRHDRSTPGAHLYKEVDESGNEVDQKFGLLNSLYVRKRAMQLASPSITVTIEDGRD